MASKGVQKPPLPSKTCRHYHLETPPHWEMRDNGEALPLTFQGTLWQTRITGDNLATLKTSHIGQWSITKCQGGLDWLESACSPWVIQWPWSSWPTETEFSLVAALCMSQLWVKCKTSLQCVKWVMQWLNQLQSQNWSDCCMLLPLWLGSTWKVVSMERYGASISGTEPGIHNTSLR